MKGPLGVSSIVLRASLALYNMPYSSFVSLGLVLQEVTPSTFSPAVISVFFMWLYSVSRSISSQLRAARPMDSSSWNFLAILGSLS